MPKGRFKDVEWNLAAENGNCASWDHVPIAVLMDIRDELKSLNRLLNCPNFTGIPTTLRSIRRAIPARKKIKK
jgi:hypothetical protein